MLAGANGFLTTGGFLDIDGGVAQDTTGLAPVVRTANNDVALLGDLIVSSVTEFGYLDDELEAGSSGSTLIVDFISLLDKSNSVFDDALKPTTAQAVTTATISLGDIGSYDRNIAWYQQNWSGTANVNTVVPVPPAALLFVSGLLSIFGLGRRQNKA